MLLRVAEILRDFIVDLFEVLSFEVNFTSNISVPFVDIIICFLIFGMVVNVFWKGVRA